MNTNAKIFMGIIVLLVIGVILTVVLGWGGTSVQGPGAYDEFAICLKDRGAVFYGAFWCPHCQSQKKLFGSSQKLLPYVECSTPDGRGQLPICTDKNIAGYPLWEFADGSRMGGEIPLEQLAEKTSCPLRQSESEASVLPVLPE